LVRHVQPAFSYCSSSDPRVHYGLGDYDGPVDLHVTWPDGGVRVLEGIVTEGVIPIGAD
jgi:hypothetical protein